MFAQSENTVNYFESSKIPCFTSLLFVNQATYEGLNDQGGHTDSFRMNLVSFSTFRGPKSINKKVKDNFFCERGILERL